MKKRACALLTTGIILALTASARPAMAFNAAAFGEAQTIGIGQYCSGVVMDDHTLWFWGSGPPGDGSISTDVRTPVKSMDNVVSVCFGDRFQLALKEDGTLWGWGFLKTYASGSVSEIAGGMSVGSGLSTNTPVMIMEDVAAVSTGSEHTMVLKKDRSLWAFGLNDHGQLGDGTRVDRSYNDAIKIMDNVQTFSAGRYHTAVITVDGSLWVWGSNVQGELGNGQTAQYELERQKVMEGVKTVSAGLYYTLAVKTDGSLWSWGHNSESQLGCGDGGGSIWDYNANPRKVMDGVRSVSAGNFHALAVKTDGSLWSWGSNYSGTLGTGAATAGTKSPVKIMDSIRTAAAGGSGGGISLAVTTDGSVLAWGSNMSGEIGDGTAADLPGLVMNGVTAVYARESNSMALKSDGSLWGWGYNPDGRVGDGTNGMADDKEMIKNTPVRALLDDIVMVSCGGNHSVAVKADGSLWGWGSNWDGQLCLGDDEKSAVLPVKLMDGVIAAAAGSYQTAAVKSDHSLWLWGINEGNVPKKIMDGVKSVSIGQAYLMALKTDGSLWGRGYNQTGYPGDGTRQYGDTPKKIMEDVAEVFAVTHHTFALKTDGSLWGWGYNAYGELGIETQYNYSLTPEKIMDNVKAVGVGESHTLVLDKNGDLYTFGRNANGELGDGTLEHRTLPQKLMSEVKAVAAGLAHSLAVKTDGSLWSWGYNQSGQLGQGGEGRWRIQYTPKKILNAVSPAPAPASDVTAVPTASTVLVNGANVAFDAYNIGGNNYFKLRDLAHTLAGTAKQFDVGWDGANNAIALTSGKAYTATGGEMTAKGAGDKPAAPTSSQIYLDGKEVTLTAYNIGGNNYFKLRDIGLAFDFGVDWDSAKNTIVIDTGKGYTPETIAAPTGGASEQPR